MTTTKSNKKYRPSKKAFRYIGSALALVVISAGFITWGQSSPSDEYYKGYTPTGTLDAADPIFKNGIDFKNRMLNEVESQCEMKDKITDNFLYVKLEAGPSRFAELKTKITGKGYDITYGPAGGGTLDADCKLDFKKIEEVARSNYIGSGTPSVKELENGGFIFSTKDKYSENNVNVLLFTVNPSYVGADGTYQPDIKTTPIANYSVYATAIVINKDFKLSDLPKQKELDEYHHQTESK